MVAETPPTIIPSNRLSHGLASRARQVARTGEVQQLARELAAGLPLTPEIVATAEALDELCRGARHESR